jgi:3',5'-cyclic-AMP phosphodiesterase
MVFLVAQITDTHLFADAAQAMRGLRTVETFETVMAAIALLSPAPDLLLFTGDLSQDESLESYQRLRRAIEQVKIPACWIAGNHDQDLGTVQAGLTSDWISPDKDFTAGSWRFLLLNSMAAQTVGGQLAEADLARLSEQLAASDQPTDQPTLIAIHHPPVAVGTPCMDAIALAEPEKLRGICDRHPQIKLIVFGHVHQEFDQVQQNIRYLGTPSTGLQSTPGQQEFTVDESMPPGFRLLRLFPDGSVETEVIRVFDSGAAPSMKPKV